MLELSEGQIIGVNHGSNDDPYVLVGQITRISSAKYDPIWFQYSNLEGRPIGYVKRNESERVVVNVLDHETTPWVLPAKIKNNMVLAWKD